MSELSLLQKLRLEYQPGLPVILKNLSNITLKKTKNFNSLSAELAPLFPETYDQPLLEFHSTQIKQEHAPQIIGVVLSGGQAPGGHNVIAGLYDAVQQVNPHSKLIGFLNGPKGIIDNKYMPLDEAAIRNFRNQGGFDLIGSGRTKIETEEQFQAVQKNVEKLKLDGLVIIGGDDSNTNAALLAEYFLKNGCKTCVVGVPKTIDGDLKNEYIEISFGFDTAAKIYSEMIGNLLRDSLSAKKYTFFIKLMGRSASHLTLECALQTHVNLALIGEEIQAEKKNLAQLTSEIADLICQRSANGKDYGVVLIPEGIIEFIPEFNTMIKELNHHLAEVDSETALSRLTSQSAVCFHSIPKEIQSQLLLDRDPHGNVQVSKIETERLFIEMVKKELARRQFKGNFSPQPLFLGYEGRSGLPSNFDSQYCYGLGYATVALILQKQTGYMSCLRHLTRPVEEWKPEGIPLTAMMHIEQRKGKPKPVIKKALVDLTGQPFRRYREKRREWALSDAYCYPGPIQFFGPVELIDAITMTLKWEQTGLKNLCLELKKGADSMQSS